MPDIDKDEYEKNAGLVYGLISKMYDTEDWHNEEIITQLKQIMMINDDILRKRVREKQLQKKLKDYGES